jgi:pyruvate-formate lyase-activating enzyme
MNNLLNRTKLRIGRWLRRPQQPNSFQVRISAAAGEDRVAQTCARYESTISFRDSAHDKTAAVATIEDDWGVQEEFTPQIRSPSNGDLHADIDIIDKCNLRCPTCWRGVAAQKNTSATMPLFRFREIVNKARAEGYPNIALINWTEPFLCKTLHEYIPIVKEAGLDCWLSSNLSLPPDKYLPTISAALSAGVDILFVSVSGFTQDVYEINHVGGRIDWIKANLEGISKELRSGKITTSVWIRYLEFPYNGHEKAPWADYARRLGVGFDPVPAHGDPNDPLPSEKVFQQHLQDRIKDFATLDGSGIVEEISSSEIEIPEKVCSLIADRIALDAKGDAYLCCAYPNADQLRIGSYVDIGESELLLSRHNHPFCATCEIPSRRNLTSKDRERFIRAFSDRTALTPESSVMSHRMLKVLPDVRQ